MKLIDLNCWGGKAFDALMQFIAEQKDSTDIFLFQEVFRTNSSYNIYKEGRVNLLSELERELQGFTVIFTPLLNDCYFAESKVNFNLEYGLAIFIKDTVTPLQQDDRILQQVTIQIGADQAAPIRFVLQVLDCQIENKPVTVVNIHGPSEPFNKLDSEARIQQSQAIINLVAEKARPIILGGDLNLLPQTQSIQMLNGVMRNLIVEFGIQNTRSVLTGFRGQPGEQKFADYLFVTSEINAKNLAVPDLPVSDHLPLVLEFDI